MRPKSGLPKRKAVRSKPVFECGLRDSPKSIALREENTHAIGEKYNVMSMFSGCGGLDLGFSGGFSYGNQIYDLNPFRIEKAIDIDAKSIETYCLNIGDHAVVGDLTVIPASELPKCRVLIGGFPCQDFSSSGSKAGLTGTRGQLYKCLVDYMLEHQPDIVIGENVPHLKRLNNGDYFNIILQDFEACGYDFDVWEIFCPDYGLSQSRRRLFFVGVRKDLPGRPERPIPKFQTSHRPIEFAIGDLIKVTDESITNQSQYFVATKATAGGGQGDHDNRKGALAYCIRANAKARIQFHYELERRLTVRECARLQSFPDEFIFPFSAMVNMTQIGNAVPPIVAHAVASSVAEYLGRLDSGLAVGNRTPKLKDLQLNLF